MVFGFLMVIIIRDVHFPSIPIYFPTFPKCLEDGLMNPTPETVRARSLAKSRERCDFPPPPTATRFLQVLRA